MRRGPPDIVRTVEVNNDDAFIDKANANIAKLRSRREQVLEMVEMYSAELGELNAELKKAEGAVIYYQTLMKTSIPEDEERSSSTGANRSAIAPVNSPMRRGSYGDLIHQAMVAVGGEVNAVTIMRMLQAQGKIPTADTAYNSVISALGRDPRFTKVGRGLFRLADLQDTEGGRSAVPDESPANG
jgi:hypothetical protein